MRFAAVIAKAFWVLFFFPHAVFCMVDFQDGGNESNAEVSKREKARLRRMELMKKQKIQEILDAQNAAVDADMVSMFNGLIWLLSLLFIQ